MDCSNDAHCCQKYRNKIPNLAFQLELAAKKNPHDLDQLCLASCIIFFIFILNFSCKKFRHSKLTRTSKAYFKIDTTLIVLDSSL